MNFAFAVSHCAWSRLVLLGSFLCTAMVDGLCFSFGLHVLHIVQEAVFTPAAEKELSLPIYLIPGALVTGMHLYASPIANHLVNCFDYRPVAMVSAYLTGFALLGSAFLRDFWEFSIVFGVCGGLGCGLVYFPALTVVAQWFESHRAMAVGLSICGSGIGTCLMAAVLQPIIERFTWRGLLILLGAAFFQLSVLIALFRPVEVQQAISLVQMQRKKRRVRKMSSSEKAKMFLQSRRQAALRPGSIMARILEEKFRQRNISTGSLDGMVITRDNQLISLPSSQDYEFVREAAAAYNLQQQVLQADAEAASPQELSGPESTGQEPSTIVLQEATNFTRSGVIRIANAVIQKLEAQAVIAPGLACPKTSIAHPRLNTRVSVCAVLPQSTLYFDVPLARFGHLSSSNHQHSNHQPPRMRYSVAAIVSPPSREWTAAPVSGIPPCRSECWAPQGSQAASTMESPSAKRAVGSNEPTSEKPALTGAVRRHIRFSHLHERPLSSIDASPATLCRLNQQEQQQPNLLTGRHRAISRTLPDVCSRVCEEDRQQQQHQELEVCQPPSLSQLSSVASLDARTDSAIRHELSRVSLDSNLKGLIRSQICHELRMCTGARKPTKGNGDFSPNRADGDNRSDAGLDAVPPAPASGGAHPIVEISDLCATSPSYQNIDSAAVVADSSTPDKDSPSSCLCSALRRLCDYLDLGLFLSPCFLLLSLACTLHMLAFFAPYHLLPLYLTLEGDGPACGKLGPTTILQHPPRRMPYLVFPQPFASPTHIVFAIGVAHLIGRILATVYLEKSINGPSVKSRKGCFRLADPMTLNVLTLLVSSLSLAFIPLAVKDICMPQAKTAKCNCFPPPLGVLYILVILHTAVSGLTISLRSVIAVELISTHHLTPAFAYLLVFQGTGAMCGPPLLALLSQLLSGVSVTSDLLTPAALLRASSSPARSANPLEPALYLCSLLLLLTALAFAPIRCVAAWEARRYVRLRARAEEKRRLPTFSRGFPTAPAGLHPPGGATGPDSSGLCARTDSSQLWRFPDDQQQQQEEELARACSVDVHMPESAILAARTAAAAPVKQPQPQRKRTFEPVVYEQKPSVCSRSLGHSCITFLTPVPAAPK
uniref:Monocarboxylate transporter 12 n=1 Tax=Schistocephalus solidus TaxID=70667 RepID=A0A0V0J8C7_SCHSO